MILTKHLKQPLNIVKRVRVEGDNVMLLSFSATLVDYVDLIVFIPQER